MEEGPTFASCSVGHSSRRPLRISPWSSTSVQSVGNVTVTPCAVAVRVTGAWAGRTPPCNAPNPISAQVRPAAATSRLAAMSRARRARSLRRSLSSRRGNASSRTGASSATDRRASRTSAIALLQGSLQGGPALGREVAYGAGLDAEGRARLLGRQLEVLGQDEGGPL